MNKELLFKIAHEAHMMGRIYTKLGEQESPTKVCYLLNTMIEVKIRQFKSKDQTIYRMGTLFRRKLYPKNGIFRLEISPSKFAVLYNNERHHYWNIPCLVKNNNFVTEAEFKKITGGEEFEPVSEPEPLLSKSRIF